LMLDIVLGLEPGVSIDIDLLKHNVAVYAAKITSEDKYAAVRDELKTTCVTKVGLPQAAAPPQSAAAPAPAVAEPKTAGAKQ